MSLWLVHQGGEVWVSMPTALQSTIFVFPRRLIPVRNVPPWSQDLQVLSIQDLFHNILDNKENPCPGVTHIRIFRHKLGAVRFHMLRQTITRNFSGGGSPPF